MEKKTYMVTFMADLTEDDVRAMKKCFYDAMLESMEISPVWNLKLEEIKEEPEPNPEATDLPTWNFKKYEPSLEELLKLPMRHIQCVKDCFAACKSSEDVFAVINLIPNMFGDFTPTFNNKDRCFSVLNTYFDGQLNDEYEEEYEFDYPDDWEFNEEDDEE